MSWVPPFFTCGLCGGEIGRWPMTNLLRQSILDWRHRNVPDTWTDGPHRAVLGTPVPKVARLVAKPEKPADDVVLPDPVPPPEVPARPALAGDLPGGAVAIDRLAETNGWEVEAWYMRGTLMDARWKANRVVASVVLRMRRDGHRLVATWQTKKWRGVPHSLDTEWAFDSAFSLTHYVQPVDSAELRRLISAPRMVCEECHEPPALHDWTTGSPVCHSESTTEHEEIT